MRKIQLLFLSLSVIINFFYPNLIFAQETAIETISEYSNPRIDIVDIKYDETIYGPEDTVTGSFSIVNKSNFDIGNIYYEIALMGRESKQTPFQKSYYFSERIGPFFVSELGKEKVNFNFNLQKNKPNEYIALRFSAFLKNGQKIGWNLKELKLVSDVSSQLYFINPEFHVEDEVLKFTHPNTVYKGEEASFVYTLKNDSNQDIRVEPKVIVKELRNQKEDYATYYENKVTVPARGSVKVFNNVRVFEDDPGIYAAQINFLDEEGNTRGRPIVFQYVVDGNILSINSIFVDYKNNVKGRKGFDINILYTGKPTDLRNPSANRVISDASVYVKVTNLKGDVIGETNQTHDFNPSGQLVLPVLIKKGAEGFNVEVKITKDGETLDEEILNVPAPIKKESNSTLILILSIIFIIALAVFIVIKKKIKIKNIKLPWLKMFIFVVLFSGVANVSSAQTIPTASITSNSIQVYRGEASPLLTWSSSNGSSYVTNRTISGTVCTGITAAVWTSKGNTASGTGYAYPSTTGAATANVSGSSTVNCTVTYTYNVTSPTGNVTTSAVSIVYIPATRPTASINFSGQSNINVGIGAPIPQVTWLGTGGTTYSTSVSVNNTSLCPGITTGTWTGTGKGNTASGSIVAQPGPTATTVPSNLLGCIVTYTYAVTPTVGPAVTAVARMSFVNASSSTASITSNSIQVYRGEASPLLTWSSSNGSSYVTNRTISGTVCTGITAAVWTSKGNTASGTGYAYPSTTGAATANVSGSSTVNCTVTYTYNVISPTGNVTTSAVSIVYIPRNRPVATSILIGGQSSYSISEGATMPSVAWVGSNGSGSNGYTTTVSVNDASKCSGINTGVWKTGSALPPASPIIYALPATAATPAPNKVGCIVTYLFTVTDGVYSSSSTATMSFIAPIIPTASITSNRLEDANNNIIALAGEWAPKLTWSSTNGVSFRTTVTKGGRVASCPTVASTWVSGNTASSGSGSGNYVYPVPNTDTVNGVTSRQPIPGSVAGVPRYEMTQNPLTDGTPLHYVYISKFRPAIDGRTFYGGGTFTPTLTYPQDVYGRMYIETWWRDPVTNKKWFQPYGSLIPYTNMGCDLIYTYEVTSATGHKATSSITVQYRNGSRPRAELISDLAVVPDPVCDSYRNNNNEVIPSTIDCDYGTPSVTFSTGGEGLFYRKIVLTGPDRPSQNYPINGIDSYKPYNISFKVQVNDPNKCPGISNGDVPIYMYNPSDLLTPYERFYEFNPPTATRAMEGCDLKYTLVITNKFGIPSESSLIVKYRANQVLDNLVYPLTNFSPFRVVYPSYLLENPIKTYENSLWSSIRLSKLVSNPWEPVSVYVDIEPSYYVDTGYDYYGMGPDGIANPLGLFVGYVPVGLNGGQIPNQYTVESNDESAYSDFWEQVGDNKGERAYMYMDSDGTGTYFQASFVYGGWDGGTYPLYMYLRYPSPVDSNNDNINDQYYYTGSPFGGLDDVGCRQGIDSTNCTNINLGPSVLLTDDIEITDSTTPGDSAYCYASIDNGLTQVQGVPYDQNVTWHLKFDKPGVDVSGQNDLCKTGDCINGKQVDSSTVFRWVGDVGSNPVPSQKNGYTPPSWLSSDSSICSQIPVDESIIPERFEIGSPYRRIQTDPEGYKFSNNQCCLLYLEYENYEAESADIYDTYSLCTDVPNVYPDTWSNIPKLSTSYPIGSVDFSTNIVSMELQYAYSDYYSGPPFEEYKWEYLQCKPLAVGGDICPNIPGTQPILPDGFSMAPSDAQIASGLATIEDRRCFPTSLAMLGSVDLTASKTRIDPGGSVNWSFSLTPEFFQGVLTGRGFLDGVYDIPRFATITWTGDINDYDGISQDFEKLNPGLVGNNNDRRVTYTEDETTPIVNVSIEDEFIYLTDDASVTVGGTCVGDDCLVYCPEDGRPIPCLTNDFPGDEAQISNFTINPSVANENGKCTLSWTTGAYTNTCTIKGPGPDIPAATSTSPQYKDVDPGTYTLSCLNHAPEITTAGPRICLQNPDLREN